MKAKILQEPATFDRVDRVKVAVGQPVLPKDDELWILGGPLLAEINGVPRTIPQGFTTDGASVPKLGQWLTGWRPWDPPQRWAGIVHDWLYTDTGTPRAYCDHALHAVLQLEGSGWWQRNIMYLAVRIGGGPAYHSDQEAGPMIYR